MSVRQIQTARLFSPRGGCDCQFSAWHSHARSRGHRTICYTFPRSALTDSRSGCRTNDRCIALPTLGSTFAAAFIYGITNVCKDSVFCFIVVCACPASQEQSAERGVGLCNTLGDPHTGIEMERSRERISVRRRSAFGLRLIIIIMCMFCGGAGHRSVACANIMPPLIYVKLYTILPQARAHFVRAHRDSRAAECTQTYTHTHTAAGLRACIINKRFCGFGAELGRSAPLAKGSCARCSAISATQKEPHTHHISTRACVRLRCVCVYGRTHIPHATLACVRAHTHCCAG